MQQLPCLDKTHVLWLVRHGEREDHVDLDWVRTAARPHDPGLSPAGIEQARAAGRRLASEGIRRIFTSPYLRCAQTARYIGESVTAPVHVEPGIGELNHPDWSEGIPVMLPMHALAALTCSFDLTHEALHDPVYPETLEDAFARAERTARAIVESYPGPVLLVGHAVSIIGVVRGLTGDPGDVPCDYASLFRLERVDDRRFEATVVGDISHYRP